MTKNVTAFRASQARRMRRALFPHTGGARPDPYLGNVGWELRSQIYRTRIGINYALIKRCIDIVLTIVLAPIVIPIIVICSILIILTMGRPVIFCQGRTGYRGQVFLMYKLRTMRAAWPGEMLPLTTMDNDPRVGPIGKFLRRTHLDELPQLWNVLLGDMSLIGPRPEQVKLVNLYRSLIPGYEIRHAVRPGLTGWAQVHVGYANSVEETRAKLLYDLYYLSNFNLRTDLKISLLTFKILGKRRYVR